MAEGIRTFEVTISEPGALAGEWAKRLVRVVIEDSTHSPAVAKVSYEDPDRTLLADTKIKLGAKLTVKVAVDAPGQSPDNVTLFTGEVVTFRAEYDGNGTFTTIYAQDVAHRLTRGNGRVNHLNQTASGIVQKTAKDAGVTVQVDPTKPVLETKAQNNTSDWSFLRELARANHMETIVIDGKLQFRDPAKAESAPPVSTEAKNSPLVVDARHNLLSLRATVTSVDQVSAVNVRGFNTATKTEIAKKVTTSSSAQQRLGLSPSEVKKAFGTAELEITDEPYRQQAEVNAAATAVADEIMGSFAELELVARGNPQLQAGVAMTLKNVGTPFDGRYAISATRHILVPKVFYETEVSVSGSDDRSTLGLTSGASAPARSHLVPGLHWGIVTDVKAGSEPGTKSQVDQPWVKVRLPMLSTAKDYQTGWIPTIQLGGVGGGGVVCPEVKDLVVVGFLGGLLDYPVVLGGVYAGPDKPAPLDGSLVDKLTGKVNYRSLSSRSGQAVEVMSARGGNGPSGVRLRTDKDRLYVYLDDAKESKPRLVMHSDGTVEIDADGEITIKGKGGITLDGRPGDLTLKGKFVRIN